MAKDKKYSDVDLSVYDNGYIKSDDVINAESKKTAAENAVANYGDFSYSKQGSFDDIMNRILNRENFSYDLNGDALYQQYKDKYIQQGKMAMQDTMGQAAAMTGGYGNSYAASVGNQAYQAQLNNLNDVIPELYQMALDKYNQEGQDLYNQYGMLSDDRNTEYGMWGDKYNRLYTDRTYYSDEAGKAYTKDYGQWADNRTYDQNQYWKETEMGYALEETNKNYARQDAYAMIQAGVMPSDEVLAAAGISKADAQKIADAYKSSYSGGGGGSGGGSGSGSGGGGKGGTYTDTLWNATGTYDDNGNPIFRNSEGKTQAYGAGINPYTGTKHKDAKHGTFSNGYQPNNIGGTKLKNSGMSTNITGKNQTIWEANGKYWLWRGDLNKYIEVDISELD